MKHRRFSVVPFPNRSEQLPEKLGHLPDGVKKIKGNRGKPVLIAKIGVSGDSFYQHPPAGGKKPGKKPKLSMAEKKLKMAEFYINACCHLGHAPLKNSGNWVEAAALDVGLKLKALYRKKSLPDSIAAAIMAKTPLLEGRTLEPIAPRPGEPAYAAIPGKESAGEPSAEKTERLPPSAGLPAPAHKDAPIETLALADMPSVPIHPASYLPIGGAEGEKYLRLVSLINEHRALLESSEPISVPLHKELSRLRTWAKNAIQNAAIGEYKAQLEEINKKYLRLL